MGFKTRDPDQSIRGYGFNLVVEGALGRMVAGLDHRPPAIAELENDDAAILTDFARLVGIERGRDGRNFAHDGPGDIETVKAGIEQEPAAGQVGIGAPAAELAADRKAQAQDRRPRKTALSDLR